MKPIKIDLHKAPFLSSYAVHGYEIERSQIREIEQFIDAKTGDMVIRLCRDIPAQLCETIDLPEIPDVEYPVDWWQAFRARWFPRWWLRRHPVRKRSVRGRPRLKLDANLYYPKMRIPNEPRVMRWSVMINMIPGYEPRREDTQ